MRSNEWFFSTSGTDRTAGDAGLALLRVVTGLALAYLHGLGKIPPSDRFIGRVGQMGMPAPELFAWLAAAAEFGGGILLAIGLLTRPVAAILVIHFIIVVFLAHAGDPLPRRELPILFGTIAMFFALTGPGRYSLDGLIGRRRSY